MPFHCTKADEQLEMAKNHVSRGNSLLYSEPMDYATIKFCAYHIFYYSMQAVLQGGGVFVNRHSKTLERFTERYIDTGIFSHTYKTSMLLLLTVHNQEAWTDDSLCDSKEAEPQFYQAEDFYRSVCTYLTGVKELCADGSGYRRLLLVKKLLTLADRFSEQNRTKPFASCENGRPSLCITPNGALSHCAADIELYSLAEEELRGMLCWSISGVMEAYVTCCAWLRRNSVSYPPYSSSQTLEDTTETENLRLFLSIFRELAKKNPEQWLPWVADYCEMLADEETGAEADRLYEEALHLYTFLYRETGEKYYRECMDSLSFKLNLDDDE